MTYSHELSVEKEAYCLLSYSIQSLTIFAALTFASTGLLSAGRLAILRLLNMLRLRTIILNVYCSKIVVLKTMYVSNSIKVI